MLHTAKTLFVPGVKSIILTSTMQCPDPHQVHGSSPPPCSWQLKAQKLGKLCGVRSSFLVFSNVCLKPKTQYKKIRCFSYGVYVGGSNGPMSTLLMSEALRVQKMQKCKNAKFHACMHGLLQLYIHRWFAYFPKHFVPNCTKLGRKIVEKKFHLKSVPGVNLKYLFSVDAFTLWMWIQQESFPEYRWNVSYFNKVDIVLYTSLPPEFYISVDLETVQELW